MKPSLITAVVLAASMSVAAGSSAALCPAQPGCAPAQRLSSTGAEVASSCLSSEERTALRAVELRDSDLADLKGGFAISDHDLWLVLGTIGVVVLIAILL